MSRKKKTATVRICGHCFEPFERGPKAKYCSRLCHGRAAHERNGGRHYVGPLSERLCAHCDEPFLPKRGDSTCCPRAECLTERSRARDRARSGSEARRRSGKKSYLKNRHKRPKYKPTYYHRVCACTTPFVTTRMATVSCSKTCQKKRTRLLQDLAQRQRARQKVATRPARACSVCGNPITKDSLPTALTHRGKCKRARRREMRRAYMAANPERKRKYAARVSAKEKAKTAARPLPRRLCNTCREPFFTRYARQKYCHLHGYKAAGAPRDAAYRRSKKGQASQDRASKRQKISEYMKKRYAANPQRFRDYQHKRTSEKPGYVKALKVAAFERRKQHFIALRRAYRKKNAAKIKRELAKWRAANRAHDTARTREWRRRNKTRVAKYGTVEHLIEMILREASQIEAELKQAKGENV